MSESSTPQKDGYVYKRRKLHSNSVALLSEQDAPEKIWGSAGENPTRSSECCFSSAKKDDQERAPGIFSEDCARNLSNNGYPKPVVVVLALPANDIAKLESAATAVTSVQSRTNKSSSLSRYYRFMKSKLVDTRECSSSHGKVVEPPGDPSTKNLCISVLREHRLLGEVCSTNACTTAELVNGNVDAKFSQSCRICKLLGNPLKMLICDLCEEAFHLSCCKPKLKKVPVDEWFCQICFRMRPKASVEETNAGKPFKYIKNEEHRKRMLQAEYGPIESLLKDTHPYVSRVRIGYDFQAEVPHWSGPISDDYNCFGEVSELDPAECASLHVWHFNKPSKPSSIGNWIQCREVIYSDTDESDEGVICGKWRRAPLFVSQTEDWDCSCALLWDPVHADCAVPQELETNEVLKHLKYLQLLKPRLAIRKQNHIQTKRDGCEQLGGTKNIHPLN